MNNIFTDFTVSLPFSSRDVSIAISNLLQTTTARWRHGSRSTQTYHSGVTEEEDKRKEKEHIKEALTRCGYPQWSISTVKTKKEDNTRKKTVEKDKSKGMLVLSCVLGLSKTTPRIMKKYKFEHSNEASQYQYHLTSETKGQS